MEVNFDGLRKRLIADYNSLARKLNRNIKNSSWDAEIIIDVIEIQREMDDIRNGLVTLAYIYQEGDNSFNTLDEDTHFETFNPNEKDE